MSAGSYVTHETKHFIYFYLGKLLDALAAAVAHEHPVPSAPSSKTLLSPVGRSLPAGQVAVLLFKSG